MTTARALSDAQIAQYRRDGFVRLDGMLTPSQVVSLRAAVEQGIAADTAHLAPDRARSAYEQMFVQSIDLWRRYEGVRQFVLSSRLGALACTLMGRPVRLFCDHALFKEPYSGAKTPWHQDCPHWPHEQRGDQLTVWIALTAASTRNGCMTFLPGSQRLRSVERIDFLTPRNVYEAAPELRGVRPVACPLEPGSCTVHNGLTFHYAGPNRTADVREALAVIFMPEGTTYSGASHPVTDNAGVTVGQPFDGEAFPRV